MIRILSKHTLMICLAIVLIFVVSGASISLQGLHNLAFLYLLKTFLSPASELVGPDLERARTSFEVLSQKDGYRYHAYWARLDGLARLLTSSPYAQFNDGRMVLEQAEARLAQGDSTRGKGLLQQAIDSNIEIIQLEAHLWLARTLVTEGDTAGYNQQMGLASNYSSQLLLQTDACSGWRLQGVFVDSRELIVDQPVHLLLIWRRPPDQTVNLPQNMGTPVPEADGDWRIWTWRDYVFQLGVISNLIADGGFERVVLPYHGVPKQLPFSLHGEQIYTDLIYAEPNISQNMTLLINGQGKISPVGLSTRSINILPLAQDVAYLVVGRFRSDETAVPQIGIRWMLKGVQTFGDNVSTYAVSQPSPQWMPYAGLFTPPVEAEKLQYWILNADPSTNLQIDDLGLWRIPLLCDPVEMK